MALYIENGPSLMGVPTIPTGHYTQNTYRQCVVHAFQLFAINLIPFALCSAQRTVVCILVYGRSSSEQQGNYSCNGDNCPVAQLQVIDFSDLQVGLD